MANGAYRGRRRSAGTHGRALGGRLPVGSYLRFSLVGVSSGVVDYAALNAMILAAPTRNVLRLTAYN